MCIIALKSEKVVLSNNQLHLLWIRNPHGAGIMYSDNDQLVIHKGLMSFDEFLKTYHEIGPMRKMVMHFRVRTHGELSGKMTHPFTIQKGVLGMCHNGIIRRLVNQTTNSLSDTAILAKKIRTNWVNPLSAIKNDFIRETLETYVGQSRVVFMDNTGQTYILNENLGYWVNGVWYSNEKYLLDPKKKNRSSKSYGKSFEKFLIDRKEANKTGTIATLGMGSMADWVQTREKMLADAQKKKESNSNKSDSDSLTDSQLNIPAGPSIFG